MGLVCRGITIRTLLPSAGYSVFQQLSRGPLLAHLNQKAFNRGLLICKISADLYALAYCTRIISPVELWQIVQARFIKQEGF